MCKNQHRHNVFDKFTFTGPGPVTFSAHPEASAETSSSSAGIPDETRITRALRSVRLNHLIWLMILLLAALSRLWDLGSRALHHDESLHTYYSWVFSEGLGYVHHPMMHGPFLFHINALSYLLFGDSDYTSRLTAAVFGIVLVMLPWLLRGRAFLGMWGAMATSSLILVSPSLLYYSRFIRHDIFAIVGAMLLFIAVVRYLEKPASRWIILAVASVGFVVTTHEITFVNLALLAAFTGALIAWRVLPAALGIVAGSVILFLVVRAILSAAGVQSVPEIPWEDPDTGQVIDYLARSVIHPVIASAIAIGLLALVAIAWLLERQRPSGTSRIDGTLGLADPGSTAGRFATALRDGRAWGIGAIIGGSIFGLLYTSMFSNIGGLGSGTLGAIGYWLGQHDVQRGEQPWFYYLVLTPQYEYLAVLGTLSVSAGLAVWAWRHRQENLEQHRRFITLALAVWWALVMFLVLSWAGEKMPWLIVHFLLPMLIVTGGGIGLVCEWVESHSREWRRELAGRVLRWGGAIALLFASSFLLINWASSGPFVEIEGQLQRTIRDDIPGGWWIVFIPAIVAIGLIVAAVIRYGSRSGLTIASAAIGCLLLVLQVNAGWNLSYRDGDVPRDMLIYVQTSPDLHEAVGQLEQLSHKHTGGMDLTIHYSGATQWPLNWYFRDFDQRVLFHQLAEAPTAPVIIMAINEVGESEAERLENYTMYEMPLRWWIPEDQTYRGFAIAPEVRTEWRQNLQTDDPPPYSIFDVIGSIGRSAASLRDPGQQASLFRLIVHRELSAPIGSYTMRVYVHDDYRQDFERIRYADSV
ncbi:MAG: TIGR03663 family protein [Sphaerobacteraceae bacterium]|nr:MAG: TIGR03663 family protein [Sphaerobacteraceae bacterium]